MKARSWRRGPWIIALGVMALAMIVFLAACGEEEKQEEKQTAASTAVATAASGYARPEALADTAWLRERLNDPKLRILDFSKKETYDKGHIPGAVLVSSAELLQAEVDGVKGQVPPAAVVAAGLGKAGVSNDSIVVVLDDSNGLIAARAFWVLKYYGHKDVRILNGGAKKWQADGGPISTEVPKPTAVEYKAGSPDNKIRVTAKEVLEAVNSEKAVIVDARTPEEYVGRDVRAARGGHIPKAVNVNWTSAVKEDGTFKSVDELRKLYADAGVTPNKAVYTYCQTGVRAAHTWFVLKYLLGYENVANYDGSWEEWGNRTDLPIDR